MDGPTRADIQAAADALAALPKVSRSALANLARTNPDWVPYLGLVVGLSQEQLKNTLRHRLGSSSWRSLARTRAQDLVAMLDEGFGLIDEVVSQRRRHWSFADVLLERFSSRRRAGRAVGRGRQVEDQVEAIVTELGLPHAMRERFVGRNGRDAPCELAIPEAGDGAAIVCAVKGFDSTGSKLTAAVTEIKQMADVRLPRQYVLAVIDGIGWLNRQSDLRRIHQLWQERGIDGVFTLSMLDDFRAELKDAASRLGLLGS